MTEREFQYLLTDLPKLTQSQLAEVRRRCSALTNRTTVSDDWLLSGLLAVLHSRGLGEEIPHGFTIRNDQAFSGFRPKSLRIRAVLEEAIPNMTRQEQSLLAFTCGECLAALIESWPASETHPLGYAVTTEAMLSFAGRIIEAVELQFPGYLAAGLLRIIIRPKQLTSM